MTAGAAALGLLLRRRATGRTVALDPSREIGAGGEARVFSLSGDRSLVAKVYHQPTAERARKVARMIEAPPRMRDPHAALAWPVDLLLTENGRFAGFLMPRAEGPRLFELYNPVTRRRSGEPCDYRMLHRAGMRVAAAFESLHAAGYVVGDVNESNVLLDAGGRVTLVDADSFQVRDPETGGVFRSRVGKAEFTPPELQGKAFADFDRTPEHDRFGLAVLLFLALMEGTHPFAGKTEARAETPPVEERIRRGLFPHHGHPEIHPPRLAPSFEVVDPALRALFVRAFVDGHRDPAARPAAAEWRAALEGADARLRRCGANRKHFHGRHLRACPWCERTRLLHGRDPFPADPARAARETRPARRSPSAAVATPAPRVPLGTKVVAGLRRPAVWIPPAVALTYAGPAGVDAVALSIFIVALGLVCIGVPKRDPRVDGLSAVAVSWIVTIAVWALVAFSGGAGATAPPTSDAVPTEAAAAPTFQIRVGEPIPAGLDAPPELLNPAEVDLQLALAASMVVLETGERSEPWTIPAAVRVTADGTVKPEGVMVFTAPGALGDAIQRAAATARFRPLTSSGAPAEVWIPVVATFHP